MTRKKILIIAGPNGVGKATFATEFLPNEADCPQFVNVDLIAAGLSPFAPELVAVKAGRLMLEALAELEKNAGLRRADGTLTAYIVIWWTPGRFTTQFRRGAGFDGLEIKAMNPKSIEQARDPDLRKSLVALKRAAKRAREAALRTKTRLVIARDGKWVRVSPAKLAQQ